MGLLTLLAFSVYFLGTVCGQSCPFGWIDEPRLGSCYFIPNSHVRYTFIKAIIRCQNLQAELVKIDSKEEADFVTSEVVRVSSQVTNRIAWWVGFNVHGNNMKVENVDGTAFNVSDVQLNITAGSRRQCGAVKDGKLILTTACMRWYGIVCERKKDTPLHCEVDNGWTPLKNSCMKIYGTPTTWNAAGRACRGDGADLVKVTDGSDMEEIWDTASMNRSSFWIGLKSSGDKFIWRDNTVEQKLQFWATKEPIWKGTSKKPACVALNGVETRRLNAWVTKNCTDDFPFICSKPQGVCPEGFLPHQTKCINIDAISPKLPWTTAKAFCRFIGAELLLLDTPSIQALVNQYLKQLMDSGIFSLWIGLSDENRATANPWRWSDGTKVNATTAKWIKDTAPTNTPSQRDCGYLKVRDGTWSATSKCDLEKNFVCEIPMGIVPRANPFPPAPQQCQTGWAPSGRSCIRVMSSSKTWTQARMQCQKIGADLVTIGSDYVQAAIEGEINQGKTYWIGLSDREHEGKYTWVNGSEVVNPRWGKGHPIKSSIVNCASISARGASASWSSGKCSSLQLFICEKTPAKSTREKQVVSTTTTTKAPFSTKCGQYWESRRGTDYCYQFHQTQVTWKDAMESCTSHNGSLVSITSREEQSYLEGRLQGMKVLAMWIGATDRIREAGWRWEDGEPFAFINWYPGEPNDFKGNEDCSAIDLATMGWYDYSCNKRNGFICKKKAISTDVTTTVSTTPNVPAGKFYGCPFGWLSYDDHCFLMKSSKGTWSDAQLACRKEGAHLASIESDLENKFIWSMFPVESCTNTANHSSCLEWALRGECGKNADWMSTNCKASCGYCKFPCSDLYTSSSCRYWASRGECQKNPTWMAKHCSKACGCDEKINSGYWVGMNDRLNSRSFTWSDLSSVTYTNWMENRPTSNIEGRKNCVMVHSTTGAWSDEPCSGQQSGYVCRRNKEVMDTQTLEPYKIGCPIGAFGYGPACYMLFNDPKTWTQAQKACRLRKANLVTISNRIVGAFITSELYKEKTSYWIGLSANGTQYSWISGVPLGYSAWVPQHTGSEQDQCVTIRSQRPVGLWEDQDCDTSLPYICEVGRRGFTTPAPTSPPTSPVSTTRTPCPSPWSGFGDYCLQLFKDPVTWQDAQTTCQAYGGTLPSVHSNTEQHFLLWLLDWTVEGAWIGLSDKDQESSYVWTDGTPFDYSKWTDSKPKSLYGTEDCTQIRKRSGKWDMKNCYLVFPFICSIPRGTIPPSIPPTQIVPAAPSCPEDGWIYHNRFCYFVSPKFSSKLSWYEASRECKSSGGDLASISTSAENNFILSIVGRMGYTTGKLWIGYNELGENSYHWSDGSPPIFTAWYENEPNDFYGGQKCVNYYSYSGRWNDDNCMQSLGYICKKVNGTSNTDVPVPTPILHSSCPPGFQGSGLTNKCFLLAGLGLVNTTDPPLNWTAARDMCRQIAAPKTVDIASINSRLDHDYATLLLQNVPRGSNLWIGMTDKEVRNNYMWMDNSEVTYTVWGKDQPANHWTISRRKDCVMMKTVTSPLLQDPKEISRWYVEKCQKDNAYLCQTSKIPGPTPPTKTPPNKQDGDCPPTFKKFDKGCYSVVNQKKTWQGARKACQFFGADLASVLDVFELAKLDLEVYNYHIVEPVWTGLFFNTSTSSYEWSDGWPVTLTSWSENDPDLQKTDSCVKMYHRFWNDTRCDELHPFVCFIRKESPPTPTPASEGKCLDDSHKAFGDFCYSAMPKDKVSWPEAAYKCGRTGMELASIHSEAEAEFVNHLVTLTSSSPSSLTMPLRYSFGRQVTSVWLGLSRDDKDGFRWSDSTMVDYFNWADGEPNSGTTENFYDEECVEMYLEGGKWNDARCVGRELGYVCKAKKSLPSTTIIIPTTKGSNSSKDGSKPNHIPLHPLGKGNNTKPWSRHSVQYYKDTSSGLTGGQIAGIVIGVAAFVAIVVVILFLVREKLQTMMFNMKTDQLFEPNQGFDNALYSRGDGQPASGVESSSGKGTRASAGDSGVSFS